MTQQIVDSFWFWYALGMLYLLFVSVVVALRR